MAGRGIAAVLIAVTIAATLFMPIHSAVAGNVGEVDIENESVNADVGNFVDLDGFEVVEGSETVEYYNETDDTWYEATDGTDYEIDNGPGAIKALEGGVFADGDEMRVSYTYEATNSTTSTVAGLVPLFVALLILGVLAGRVTDMM